MKSLGFRVSVCWLGLVLLAILEIGCGALGGGKSSAINGYMTGAWDFIVTNPNNGHIPFIIEANLNQDHKGNISSTGSVTANGPAGNAFDLFIFGGSLSTPEGIAVDYLGYTCNGADTGDRSITGSVNSSNQVTLTQNDGGTLLMTITGTLDNSAMPPFTGTLTAATGGACEGPGSFSVIGLYPASVFTGTYAGTSAADPTETISVSITNTSGALTGTGTDSKLGSFTMTGNAVGDALSATLTYATSPASSGPVYGYFDQQLGGGGSIVLISFNGVNTPCPAGIGSYNGSCQLATLARQ